MPKRFGEFVLGQVSSDSVGPSVCVGRDGVRGRSGRVRGGRGGRGRGRSEYADEAEVNPVEIPAPVRSRGRPRGSRGRPRGSRGRGRATNNPGVALNPVRPTVLETRGTISYRSIVVQWHVGYALGRDTGVSGSIPNSVMNF